MDNHQGNPSNRNSVPPARPKRETSTTPPPRPNRGPQTPPPLPAGTRGKKQGNVWHPSRQLLLVTVGGLLLLSLLSVVGSHFGILGPTSTTAADYTSAEVREVIRLLMKEVSCRDTCLDGYFEPHKNSLELWERVLGQPTARFGREDSPTWTYKTKDGVVTVSVDVDRHSGAVPFVTAYGNGDSVGIESNAPVDSEALRRTITRIKWFVDPGDSLELQRQREEEWKQQELERELATQREHEEARRKREEEFEFAKASAKSIFDDLPLTPLIFFSKALGADGASVQPIGKFDELLKTIHTGMKQDDWKPFLEFFDVAYGMSSESGVSTLGDGKYSPYEVKTAYNRMEARGPDFKLFVDTAADLESARIVFYSNDHLGIDRVAGRHPSLQGWLIEWSPLTYEGFAVPFSQDLGRAVIAAQAEINRIVSLNKERRKLGEDVPDDDVVRRAAVRDQYVQLRKQFLEPQTEGVRPDADKPTATTNATTPPPPKPTATPAQSTTPSATEKSVVQPLTILNTAEREQGLWVSPDGLRIYFGRSGSPTTVYLTERRDINSDFGPASAVATGRHPTLSGDELTMIALGARPDGRGESLQVARRTDRTKPFSQPEEIRELLSVPNPKTPFLSPDGHTLVFVAGGTPDVRQLVFSTRPSETARWSNPKPLPMDDVPKEAMLSWPFLSEDGLLLIAADESESGAGQFLIWKRVNQRARFTNPAKLVIPGEDIFGRSPHYVEATSELFFSSTRPRRSGSYLEQQKNGNWDLWAIRHLSLIRSPGTWMNSPATDPSKSSAWLPDGPPGVVQEMDGHGKTAFCVALSPGGYVAISGGQPQDVILWSPATGKELRRTEADKSGVRAVGFQPGGNLMMAATHHNRVFLWDARSGDLVHELVPTSNTAIYRAQFTPDGQRVVAGDYFGNATVFDAATGKELLRIAAHEPAGTDKVAAIRALDISPDGKILATGGNDAKVRLWNLQDGTQIGEFAESKSAVWTVRFTPDGKQLVSGGGSEPLQLWDADSRKVVQQFVGHPSVVVASAFLPSGNLLTGSVQQNGKVPERPLILWDTQNGKELMRFDGLGTSVWDIAASPDGRFAIVACGDGKVRVVRLPK